MLLPTIFTNNYGNLLWLEKLMRTSKNDFCTVSKLCRTNPKIFVKDSSHEKGSHLTHSLPTGRKYAHADVSLSLSQGLNKTFYHFY